MCVYVYMFIQMCDIVLFFFWLVAPLFEFSSNYDILHPHLRPEALKLMTRTERNQLHPLRLPQCAAWEVPLRSS